MQQGGKLRHMHRASKYTDLPVFLRISDYKYGRNFENTESFGQLGKHYYVELIVKYGNCIQNTEKLCVLY